MSEPFEFIYGSTSKQIRKCDGNTGKCSHVYEGHLTSVSSICFTSNFDSFVSLCDDKLIIWDADTGKKLQVLEGRTSWFRCVAISPDDLTIVSGGDDSNVMVWDLPTGKLKMILKGHEDSVLSVAISPTGDKIASGSTDDTTRIWSLVGLDAGKLLFTLKNNDYSVSSVIFIPCAGQQVISGSWDRSIRVWSVDNGVNVGIIDVESGVLSLAVTSFGDKMVCSCYNRSVRVYDIKTRKLIRQMDGHIRAALRVAITPDDQYIISIGSDCYVIKWRMDNGEKLQTFIIDGSTYPFVACCPSALISDRNIQLKFSGRIVNTSSRKIVYAINTQTRVEARDDIVVLREEEIVVTAIKASDSSKAGEWKKWILAVQINLSLPKTERLKTGTGIMARYKSEWLQVMNITKSAKVDFLPKHTMNLIIHYIYK